MPCFAAMSLSSQCWLNVVRRNQVRQAYLDFDWTLGTLPFNPMGLRRVPLKHSSGTIYYQNSCPPRFQARIPFLRVFGESQFLEMLAVFYLFLQACISF